MWKRATLGLIVLIAATLVALLFLRIGGLLPAVLLVIYIPFVLVGMAALKWILQGFRARRYRN